MMRNPQLVKDAALFSPVRCQGPQDRQDAFGLGQ